METNHIQVLLTKCLPNNTIISAEVDARISPLIGILWANRIYTESSCQEVFPGFSQVIFSEFTFLQKFIDLIQSKCPFREVIEASKRNLPNSDHRRFLNWNYLLHPTGNGFNFEVQLPIPHVKTIVNYLG